MDVIDGEPNAAVAGPGRPDPSGYEAHSGLVAWTTPRGPIALVALAVVMIVALGVLGEKGRAPALGVPSALVDSPAAATASDATVAERPGTIEFVAPAEGVRIRSDRLPIRLVVGDGVDRVWGFRAWVGSRLVGAASVPLEGGAVRVDVPLLLPYADGPVGVDLVMTSPDPLVAPLIRHVVMRRVNPVSVSEILIDAAGPGTLRVSGTAPLGIRDLRLEMRPGSPAIGARPTEIQDPALAATARSFGLAAWTLETEWAPVGTADTPRPRLTWTMPDGTVGSSRLALHDAVLEPKPPERRTIP